MERTFSLFAENISHRALCVLSRQLWPHLTTFFYTNTTLETLFTAFLAVNIVLPFLFLFVYVSVVQRKSRESRTAALRQEVQGAEGSSAKKASQT